jgi:hypothetical protein
MSNDPLVYYAQPTAITDLEEHADRLKDLPASIPELCWLVQGVMIHTFWLDRYGVTIPQARQKEELQIRSAAKLLQRVWELDDRPLAEARPLERRLVGNCRDFTTLLTALLRHQGIPARGRCGFGTFFLPGRYEDHWQCEIWRAGEKRWRLADAQLDDFQRRALKIDFDPTEIPEGAFLTAGAAWRLCRAGQADPATFGIFDMSGMGFILGNLLRDLAALNKVELLPWDCWGIMNEIAGDEDISETHLRLLDEVAQLTTAADTPLSAIRAIYENEPGLRVPPTVRSHVAERPIEEHIGALLAAPG